MPYFQSFALVLSKQLDCFLAGLSLKIQFAGKMLFKSREFNSQQGSSFGSLFSVYMFSICDLFWENVH